MVRIERYFPALTAEQRARFAALSELYAEWNARINVISRKDMEHFMERHVLHSLAIAKVRAFGAGERVLDVGTGGGFPGIPLAIMFPEARFTLVDSIGKKISVVRGVSEALGLTNVEAVNGRAENVPGHFDCMVTRAVAPMSTLRSWVGGKCDEIIALKGGDLTAELAAAGGSYTLYNIADFFDGEFFETKKVVLRVLARSDY
jgi:16S rRNA (guanine527-N7)-methyltransferase